MKKTLIITIACLSASLVVAEKTRQWSSVQSWVYQLCNYTDNRLDEIAESEFDLAVIDLTRDGGAGNFTSKEIKAVKGTGKIVLAYFEIGAIEEYRPEWKSVPADLKAGKVDGWPHERYVKFWERPVFSHRKL